MSKRKADPAADAKDKKRLREEEAKARMMQDRRENSFIENTRRVFDTQASEVTTFIRHSIVEPLVRSHPTAEFSKFELGQKGWVLIVEVEKRQYSITCLALPRAKVANKPQGSGDHYQINLACEDYGPTLAVSGPGLAPIVQGKADEVLSKLNQAVQSD